MAYMVVNVLQDCDYVEEVEFVAFVNSYEEASDLLNHESFSTNGRILRYVYVPDEEIKKLYDKGN